ncbi:MAG TPA: tRNA lysidine(34) synthetase TilS [bacterium]|nr:tRNA lysidine(34) synthetase TilS [bacterium]HPR88298.1 tRNA lysidine(34) synthetase TilS [bacterium]
MLDPFMAFIREHDLLEPGARLLVAVSGGLDSVVLLDLLASLTPEWRLELTAAHFNHGLRGTAADADEAFVRDLCARRGIPCETGRGQVREYARLHHLGLEEAGRDLRYAFLGETARRCGCSIIATGHHAGDQAETVLDRLIRGTGVRGLAGIAPSRLLGPADATSRSLLGPAGIAPYRLLGATGAAAPPPDRTASAPPAPLRLIRPLLFASRSDIAAWAQARGLAFREDASNRDRRIRRNRIRHELLPLLMTYNPRIEATLGQTAAHLREVEAYLCMEGEKVLDRCALPAGAGKIILEKEPFLSYLSILQKYALRAAWRRIGGASHDLDAAFWPQWQQFIAAGHSDRGYRIGSGAIWLTEHHLVLLAARPATGAPLLPLLPGRTPLWDGWTLEIKALSLPLEQIEKNSDPRLAWIDGARLRGTLLVRTMRPGDRIHPLGLRGSKKVADLLAEAGIPVYDRSRHPLLWCGDEIVWVCGIRAGDPFRVTVASTLLYQLKVERNLD